MKSKTVYIIIGVIVLVILGGIVLIRLKFKAPREQVVSNREEALKTREEVPKDIRVPEPGEKAPENVAVPKEVTEAAPNASTKARFFEIVAENNKYIPSEIIVNEGDLVNIKFKSNDQTYDITIPDYGIKQIVNRGEEKIIEFQAVIPGKFTYYCDLCERRGIKSKVVGHIIVVPK